MKDLIQTLSVWFSWIPNENILVVILLTVIFFLFSIFEQRKIIWPIRLVIYAISFCLVTYISTTDWLIFYTYANIPYYVYFLSVWLSIDFLRLSKLILEKLFNKPIIQRTKSKARREVTQDNNSFMSPLMIFSLSFAFIFSTFLVFLWGETISWGDIDVVANTNKLGTFGDFVGGVLGTLLTMVTVYLMYKTFTHQREVTERNRIQIELQRFNDIFFKLLSIYKAEVDKINKRFMEEISPSTKKDFFTFYKEEIQNQFDKRDLPFEQKRNLIIGCYMDFYVKANQISVCFRNLYRIYDFVEKTVGVDDKIKKDYLKIVRAELTTPEMFFLKYDAFTVYGQNFSKYIVKYNILKHLPKMELLEYKSFWKFLNNPEKTCMNIILDTFVDIIRALTRHQILSNVVKNFSLLDGILYITASMPKPYILKTYILINLAACTNDLHLTNALKKLSITRLSKLFDTFLRDLFFPYDKSSESHGITYSQKVYEIFKGIYIIANTVETKVFKNHRAPLKVNYYYE